MNLDNHLVFVIAGLIALCLAAPVIYRWFNPEQRAHRKRRRNYGKVVPRVKRPMVILNVQPPKR